MKWGRRRQKRNSFAAAGKSDPRRSAECPLPLLKEMGPLEAKEWGEWAQSPPLFCTQVGNSCFFHFFAVGNVPGPWCGVCKKMAIFNIHVKYVNNI